MRKSHTAGGRCDKFHVGLVTWQLDAQEQHPGDAISASSGVAGQMLTALKSLSAVIALSALSVLILSCSRTPDPNDVVKRLPELPPQLAANLTSTKIDNVLMTKDPPKVVKPAGPPKLQACTRDYVAYVSYPMTVCFPPEELPDREWETAGAQVEAPKWSPASQPAPRYYKLLSKSTGPPYLLCRVTNGPWLAEVTTNESCDGGADSLLTITGVPQPFSVAWLGGISDIPPPFNPNAFSGLTELPCKCCGVLCPDGRCVAQEVNCNIHP